VHIRMPGMSGLETSRQLGEEDIKAEYVVITGYSDFQYAKEGIDLGVAGYILKPVTYEDIEQILVKVRGKRTGRETDTILQGKISLANVRGLVKQCSNLLVKKAIRYVDEHLNVPCRLAQTARDLMISPEHLSRSFHEETGMTFTDYVRLVKLDYAMVLLRKTSLKVQEISWMIGMENDKYFHNVFKETVGMTPRRYRMITSDEAEDAPGED